jgi:hypothetical protein
MRRLHWVGLVVDVERFWGLGGVRGSHNGGHCSLIKCCGGHLGTEQALASHEEAYFWGLGGK